METKIAIFKRQEIRKTIYKNEWYFSVIDIVKILTDSFDAKQYIKKMRMRDPELNSYWGTICTPLELMAKDGKKRKIKGTDTFFLTSNKLSLRYMYATASKNSYSRYSPPCSPTRQLSPEYF